MQKILRFFLPLLLLPSLAFGAGSSATQPSANVLRADISSTAANKGAALVGFKAIGAGAVPRTLQEKARERVSVKDSGAVCNDAVDDLAAFNVAIAAIKAAGGGELIVPKGVCRISGAVRLARDMRIVGEGARSVIKVMGDASGLVFDETVDGALARNISIEGLSIVKAAPTSTPGVFGVSIVGTTNNAWGIVLRDVWVQGFYTGVRIVRPIVSEVSNVESYLNALDGFEFSGAGTSLKVGNSFARLNGRNGYTVMGGLSYIGFDTTASDQNGGHGYFYGLQSGVSPVAVSLLNAGAESNAGAGFHLEDVENFTFVSPFSLSNAGAGFVFDGARGVVVVGGRAASNTGYGVTATTSATPRAPSTISTIGTSIVGNTAGRINGLSAVSEFLSPDTNNTVSPRGVNGLWSIASGVAAGCNGLVVDHGAGVTPTVVHVVPESSTVYGMGVNNITSTQFTLLMRDSAGALVGCGSPVNVRWSAIK